MSHFYSEAIISCKKGMLEALDSTISTNEQNIYLPQCIYIYILVYALPGSISFISTSKYFLFSCMIHYILKWACKHLMMKLVRDILMCSIHEHISAGSYVSNGWWLLLHYLYIMNECACFYKFHKFAKFHQISQIRLKNAISKLQRHMLHSGPWLVLVKCQRMNDFFGKLDDISIQQQAIATQHDAWNLIMPTKLKIQCKMNEYREMERPAVLLIWKLRSRIMNVV